ncbi:hypothetical protein OUZ56_011976 [Daphnia magna]|uniref:Uncharacterized protein n=1 Tax=Daphnia magna TaxID=35525 RepID=A0ABQ9Z1R8_9CRUS|nr:hypothetical protein OUZ56_011976 [Daphnia magna]
MVPRLPTSIAAAEWSGQIYLHLLTLFRVSARTSRLHWIWIALDKIYPYAKLLLSNRSIRADLTNPMRDQNSDFVEIWVKFSIVPI